ncbi:hypothetical protein FEE42_01720 [Rodentibacter caecimuris]|nr:hypothetical protein [Rodentibacter heylii]QIA76160.1 hypothetical protein FEE42_01720 [Rodentibacter heylii]
MRNMFKDPGNQSYFWSSFSGLLAWLSDQQNLMLLSLAIGILTALVNLYSKCSEGRARRRAEEREEEIHALKVQQLKRGLRDE